MKSALKEKRIKILGERIKQLRIEQKLSQIQLAFEAGIPREQLGRIEKGQISTGINTIFKLSDALNIPVKDLFDF